MKSQNKKTNNNNKKRETKKAKKMWNYRITNTNIKQNCQESRYLFYCKFEQSSQNNQCTRCSPLKYGMIFSKQKLLMRGQKLFCAKKLWGGCSKLED